MNVLYHFTNNLYVLENILDNGLIFRPSDTNDDQCFISTTRNYDFKWGGIRITLNADKIKQRYKIKPINFFYKHIQYWKSFHHINTDQMEERILSPVEGFLDPSYILQVDLDWIRYQTDVGFIKSLAEKHSNIEINLVDSFVKYRTTA